MIFTVRDSHRPVQLLIGFQVKAQRDRVSPGRLLTPVHVHGVVGVIQPVDIGCLDAIGHDKRLRVIPVWYR